jgi:hypothetical protein
MAGIKHAKRRRDVWKLRRPELAAIDSGIPTKKTMNYGNYLRYVSYMNEHYEALINYYGIRFNKLKFQTYVGSQMACSEVNITLLLIFI